MNNYLHIHLYIYVSLIPYNSLDQLMSTMYYVNKAEESCGTTVQTYMYISITGLVIHPSLELSSLGRPHLEYATPMWNCLLTDITLKLNGAETSLLFGVKQ